MKSKNYLSYIFISFFSLFYIFSNAQTQYEKGYFIDNHANKVECFIKNIDWKNNPTEIIYKKTENSDKEIGDISSISKFEIYDEVIYLRDKVEVAINSSTSNKLNYSETMEVQEKQVFLKLLVGGKTNLYVHKDANSKLFYYQPQNGDIQLLEYKEYINDKNQITKNQNYKRTLWENLKCSSMNVSDLVNINYTQSDLSSLFEDYNRCQNALTYTFKNRKRKKPVNFNIRPGLNFAKTNFDGPGENVGRYSQFDFDKEISFRLGLEVEFVLPFNNDKWALIFEPTYQYYNTEKTFDTNPRPNLERVETSTVSYSSIEFPIGFRYYSYLNENSRLFFNASGILDASFGTEIDYGDTIYKSNSGFNFAFGVGFNYLRKYSVETRIFTKRDILNNYATIKSDYLNFSLIFGYTVF